MSKCRIDVKRDIVNTISDMMTEQGAVVVNNTGYFTDGKKAEKNINRINDMFQEAVVTPVQESSFIIDPSDNLVETYYNAYVDKSERLQREQENEKEYEARKVKEAASNAEIPEGDFKKMYDINRNVFGLGINESLANAVIMDRMIMAMATRAGVSKEDMYEKINFEKKENFKTEDGVKFQINAWHGSPYLFDKFSTSKIGEGEGSQGFGWGMYFTELKDIAKYYAKTLGAGKFIGYNGEKDSLNYIWETDRLRTEAYEALKDVLAKNPKIKSKTELLDAIRKEYDKKKTIFDFFFGKKIAKDAYQEAYSFVDSKVAEYVPASKNLYNVTINKGKKPSEYEWIVWDRYVAPYYVNDIVNLLTARDKKLGDEFRKDVIKNGNSKFTGQNLYQTLSLIMNSEKEVSKLLLEIGIDGVKYPAESIAKGKTSDTARGFNYVVFDENAVNIEKVIRFQKKAENAKGAAMIGMDGQATIYALTDPDISTPLHEMAHVFEHYLTKEERNTIIENAGTTEWNTETSEYFARGFEKYLSEGKSPEPALNSVFKKFSEWLLEIYKGIIGSEIDIQLNDEMRRIYKKMLTPTTEKNLEKVTELFERDSTLANQVYEALGFLYSPLTDEAKLRIENKAKEDIAVFNRLLALTKKNNFNEAYNRLVDIIIEAGKDINKRDEYIELLKFQEHINTYFGYLINDINDKTAKDTKITDVINEIKESSEKDKAKRKRNKITPQQKQQAIQLYSQYLEFETSKKFSTNIASTIYELIPNITEDKIDEIYDNYVLLMGRVRKNKEVPRNTFKNLLKTYQVFNYKDTYIFGNYDSKNGVFITRMNSSPSSKELLAEALPMLVKQGIDFASFVPQDVANKYKRSGYSVSIQGFDYNFKGENMVKYLAVSNPNVSLKVFGKNLNEISTKEIKDYDKSINLKYEPVEIKGDLIEKAGRDAAKIFETYLNQFGIQVKDINEIKDKLGIDELGFADILSKIAYVKDKKDLPPVAGEFIAYMMQYNPLVSDIIKELSQTTSYKNLNKEQYFKIIGGLIADDLQNKLEGNYSKSLLDKLKQLIKKFFSLLRDTPIDLINKNIGIISDNILQQNKKLITSSLYKPGAFGKPTKQVSLQEAMESDKFGASIIKNLSKKGFILTGSTSLGEQGTIQRPDENLLHDIDWVSPFNRKQTEDLFKEVYPEAIKIRDIYGDGYITDTWIIAPKGYKIINLNKESDYNIITSYDIVNTDTNEVVGTYRLQEQTDSNQKEEVVTGIEAKVIDFFTYDNYNERSPFEKDGIKLSNWKDIFKAKLQFARYKDIWDYNRFIPNDNVSQITQQQGSVERFKDWINNRQKNEEELVEYLKQKYPEIKLTITNNPIWEQGDNVFNQEEYNNQVRYRLKAIDILSSDKAKQIFEKGKKANWDLNKILTELQVPKEQKQLILDLGKTNREEIITDLLANYSYTVEINTAKNIISSNPILGNSQLPEGYVFYTDEGLKVTWQNNILDLGSVGIELYQLTDRPDISKAYYKELEKFKPVEKPTQHYSNLTVPGGTNYTENEIATPAITPSIEGHAQFSTPNGLMWSRTDERVQYEEQDIDNLLKIMENSKILQIKCS